MIASLAAAAAMSAGALAASFGLHPAIAAASFGVALALLVWRPRWSDRAPRVPTAIGVGAVAAFAALAAVGIGALPYRSDAVVAAHAGAERVLAGHDPYRGFDLVAELARFGLPPEYATPLEDGTRLRAFQYPVLTALVPAPFVGAGLRDVRVLYLVELLLFVALLARAVPPPARGAVGLVFALDLAVLGQYVLAGVDPLWAVLVLGAWLLRARGVPSAVVLGLSLAARQTAWVVAPFLIAWAWREHGAGEAARRAAIAAAVALAIHLPFLIAAPEATVGGILAPAILPLEAWGVGPAKLGADGIGPLLPRAAYLAAAVAAYAAGLWAYASRRAPRGAFALALAPLWLSWRALQSYFALLPLLALSDLRSGEALAQDRVLDLVPSASASAPRSAPPGDR